MISFIISILPLICPTVMFTTCWLSHVHRSHGRSKEKFMKFRMITFPKFLKLFYKVNWKDPVMGLTWSYFVSDRMRESYYFGNYIHGGVIIMDGVGYFFDPFSYLIFCIWSLKRHKSHPAFQFMEL